MPYVEANGISLYYEEHGEGEPLVFISGLGRNHSSWAPVIPAFVDTRRCIVFDNRGTGRSAVPPGPYAIEELADDLSELLNAVGVESADCIGVSLGASVLQALSYRHPEKVRRAVLVSAFPSYTQLQEAWLDAGVALRRSGASAKAVSVSGLPWVFTPRLLSDHAEAVKFVEMALNEEHPTSLEGFLAQAAAIRVFDSRPHLGAIGAPVLILVGAEDVLTPVHQSVEMAELIPNCQLRVLARGGHGMMGEYKDDVIQVVRQWLG